jgi:hypothetical protein
MQDNTLLTTPTHSTRVVGLFFLPLDVQDLLVRMAYISERL